ncbi:unnamed protein product, partial [marine sediment metagenome]
MPLEWRNYLHSIKGERRGGHIEAFTRVDFDYRASAACKKLRNGPVQRPP